MKKIIILLSIILIPNVAFAHGGEVHDDENTSSKEIKNSSENKTIDKVYYSDNNEILLKYDSLHADEISNFDLFITDINNKGVEVNKSEIIFEAIDNSQANKTSSKFEVEKTNTTGWYQGHINIKSGDYKVTLVSDNKNTDLGIFNVETIHTQTNTEIIENPSIRPSLIIFLIFLLISSLYIFFDRSKDLNNKGNINEI